jgi:glycosyltransferase involved in cell wall biosynthesis
MISNNIAVMCTSVSWAGTEKWALRSSEELAKSGRKVFFFARKSSVFHGRSRFPLNFIQLPFRNDGDLLSILRMVSILKKEKVKVLIATRVRDYWLGGLAAKMAGIPMVLRLGIVREPRSNHFMDYFRYGFLPSSYIVNAVAIKETLAKKSWIKEDKVAVIYNGVDAPGAVDQNSKDLFRQELGLSKDSIFIVGAGRLAVEKRWDWLISASSELIESGKKIDLFILGEGNERPLLEKLILDNGLEKRVRLMGLRDDSIKWLGAADIVVLPSRNEGISNTMLEAMGQEVPVVVTASGGVREHFENEKNIFLSDRDSFKNFLDILKKAITDKQLRTKVATGGFSKAEEVFQWSAMTSNIVEIIDSLVEK